MQRLAGLTGAGLMLLMGATAQAQDASWAFQNGPATLILAAGAEDVQFIAQCEAGTLDVTYMAPDRAQIAAGTETACGGERPCREKLPATLLVDGKATAVTARAQPEEMYGGYEIHFLMKASDPFWTAMARGRKLALTIDGNTGEALSLKGVAKPLGKLLAACKG